MVKKSIIAIALMCMLSTVSFGQDGFPSGQFKIDGLWPATIDIYYTPQEICRIPVFIKVGMFIQVKDCSDKEIIMEQVNCPSGQTFPCYKGCTNIGVRSNFKAKISLELHDLGTGIIQKDTGWFGTTYRWKAYFTDGSTTDTTWIIPAGGNWEYVDVCVEAWDANIYNGTPGSTTQVGEVAILAIPDADPDYCDYCP
jgi:hypothetical protein